MKNLNSLNSVKYLKIFCNVKQIINVIIYFQMEEDYRSTLDLKFFPKYNWIILSLRKGKYMGLLFVARRS